MGQVSRRDFLKRAAPVVVGLGLAGALGVNPTFGSPSSPTTAPPSPGNQLSTASYVIYYQNKYYAQNGTTGRVDYSGTDAAAIIQATIDTLIEGGLIVLRRGIYTLNSGIRIAQGIDLLGEQGAVLKVGDGAQTPSNPFNILELIGDDVTVENLELDGNAGLNPNLAGITTEPAPANPYMQNGIVVRSGRNCEIFNCFIHDIWNAGVWLAAADGDVVGAEIASCLISRTGKSFTDPSSTNQPQSANAVYVFRLQGSTSGTSIHDNSIVEPFGRGIYLHFDQDTIVSNNSLTKTPDSSAATAGIVVDDETKRVILKGNQISGYGPGILVVWAGCEDIIVEANACFDAPNSGGSGSGILVDTSTTNGAPLRTLIIKGNICKGNALPGISVSASETIVEGNICYNNNKDCALPQTRRAGILVLTGQSPMISHVSVIGNRCFDDQSPPSQIYGISISQAPNLLTDVLVANNDLRDNGTGAIGELDCSQCRVTGNLGYNPQGIAQITVGGSPFTYTNRDGVPEAVYVAGGSVSEISKGGAVLFTAGPATIWLDPDESVTITHLDPPQMLKDRR
jgi:parallel beta-helix repeat protein